jgi:drug/metabolite transporter (DMT)-like permease
LTTIEKIETPRQQSPWVGIAALALGGFLVGLAPIGLRYAVDSGLGPQTTAFWRYALAVPLFLAFFAFRGRAPGKPNFAAILAGVFFALDIGFWHLALTMTSVANATFIVNLGSIGVGFLAWIVLKDRPSAFWGVAIILAISGAYLLSSGGAEAGGETGLKGDMVAVLAACFVSLYMLCAAIARKNMSAIDVIFWATVTEMFVAALMAFSFGESLIPPDIDALSVPLFLAVFSQIGGQGCIVFGFGRAPPSIAGVMVLVQPVTAALISWPLFGEELALMQLFGAGLILIGLLIAQLRLRRSGTKP